jgi:hypothetical protein
MVWLRLLKGATDFIDALASLHSEDSRRWLLDEFQDLRSGFNESYVIMTWIEKEYANAAKETD